MFLQNKVDEQRRMKRFFIYKAAEVLFQRPLDHFKGMWV